MTPRSRSGNEVIRFATQRPDSGKYFDGEPSQINPQGTWIAGPNRWRPHFFDHFEGKALHPRWNLQDTSSAGAPTSAGVNAIDGLWSLKLASTNEAETYGINFGDLLNYSPHGLVVKFGFTVAAALSTSRRIIIGMGSAHNDTLDNIASNAWFKIDADANLVVESDDGTTDNDDKDTTIDLTAGQLIHCRIEILSPTAVYFFAGTGSTSIPKRVQAGTTFSVSTSLLQPMAIVQKDSGTTQDDLRIDYFGVYPTRG